MGTSHSSNSVVAGHSHKEHFRKGLKGMFAKEMELVHKWASEDYKEG